MDNTSKGLLAVSIFLIVFFVILFGLSVWEDQRFKTKCESLGGQVVREANETCIKDGRIILNG